MQRRNQPEVIQRSQDARQKSEFQTYFAKTISPPRGTTKFIESCLMYQRNLEKRWAWWTLPDNSRDSECHPRDRRNGRPFDRKSCSWPAHERHKSTDLALFCDFTSSLAGFYPKILYLRGLGCRDAKKLSSRRNKARISHKRQTRLSMRYRYSVYVFRWTVVYKHVEVIKYTNCYAHMH